MRRTTDAGHSESATPTCRQLLRLRHLFSEGPDFSKTVNEEADDYVLNSWRQHESVLCSRCRRRSHDRIRTERAHADGALTVNQVWARDALSHDVQQIGRGDGIQHEAGALNTSPGGHWLVLSGFHDSNAEVLADLYDPEMNPVSGGVVTLTKVVVSRFPWGPDGTPQGHLCWRGGGGVSTKHQNSMVVTNSP